MQGNNSVTSHLISSFHFFIYFIDTAPLLFAGPSKQKSTPPTGTSINTHSSLLCQSHLSCRRSHAEFSESWFCNLHWFRREEIELTKVEEGVDKDFSRWSVLSWRVQTNDGESPRVRSTWASNIRSQKKKFVNISPIFSHLQTYTRSSGHL